MATKTIATGVVCSCLRDNESYDHIVWKIYNWHQLGSDKQKLENQQFVFTAGENSLHPSKGLIALKFDIGWRDVNFKLLESKATEWQISLEAIVELKKTDGTLFRSKEVEKPLIVNQEASACLFLKLIDVSDNQNQLLDKDNALTIEIKLTVRNQNGVFIVPVATGIDTGLMSASPKKSMESFEKAFVSKILKSYGQLLNDNSSSDTKIISSDGKEFQVHCLVLKAQCPIFQSMLSPENQFTERETGKMEVKDVTGKTMEILLRYFNTGELLPTWRDADTIFEFTYAAGKCQMTEILEMLDEMIGIPEDSDATCIMPFLSLVNKLGLKKAELQLVKRISKQAAAAKTGEDLFKILE